jgi:hypothetical protein
LTVGYVEAKDVGRSLDEIERDEDSFLYKRFWERLRGVREK